jgi:hypothetical protein
MTGGFSVRNFRVGFLREVFWHGTGNKHPVTEYNIPEEWLSIICGLGYLCVPLEIRTPCHLYPSTELLFTSIAPNSEYFISGHSIFQFVVHNTSLPYLKKYFFHTVRPSVLKYLLTHYFFGSLNFCLHHIVLA